MERRLQLVVNPSAGRGRAAALLPSVEAALRGAGHDLVVTLTRSLDHADDLAAAAVADDRVAVAMGGDGIAGRVAGIVAGVGGVMGVVPGGRGNDFCRATGVPSRAVQACAVLSSGTEQAVDLGVVESVTGTACFLGIASIGFDSDVQEIALTTRLRLGQLVYAYGTLRAVAAWRPATFTLRLDDTPSTLTGWSVAVANSGVYGGGMKLAPQASLQDGLLDVVTTSSTGRLRFLRSFPSVFKGTHVTRPSVRVTRAAAVHLDADRPFRVFADGDPVGVLPCTVSVLPGAVRMLLPYVSARA